MKKLLLLTIVSSCAHTYVRDFYLPDGSIATEVRCTSERPTYKGCIKLVDEHCGSRSYDLLGAEKSIRLADGSYLSCSITKESEQCSRMIKSGVKYNITFTVRCK